MPGIPAESVNGLSRIPNDSLEPGDRIAVSVGQINVKLMLICNHIPFYDPSLCPLCGPTLLISLCYY